MKNIQIDPFSEIFTSEFYKLFKERVTLILFK